MAKKTVYVPALDYERSVCYDAFRAGTGSGTGSPKRHFERSYTMKKHLVRLMALLLAASMLAACGSNSVNTAGSTETTSAKAAD